VFYVLLTQAINTMCY